MRWRANPGEETTDWRAVCGRPARTVRREGRRKSSLPLFQQTMVRSKLRGMYPEGNQVTRKLLAHTVGVCLNLRQDREPLDLDGLLAA